MSTRPTTRSLKRAVFRISRALGLFQIARWMTRNRLRILCYHGFSASDEVAFRPKLFIDSERFEKRLQIIRRYGMVVLPIDEALERLYSSSLPKHAVLITVDDGLQSFYRIAVPILARYKFPSVVYVTTYYVRNPEPVFGLVIQYMFWKSTKRTITLPQVVWTQRRSVDLSNADDAERLMWECISYGERRCTKEQRRELCVELSRLLDVPYESIVTSRALHLMTPEELRSLDSHEVTVGLHTHRHRFPADNRELAKREIEENRFELGRSIPKVTAHFCYPSGLWQEHQWSWLEEFGIKSSVTCLPGLNSASTPRHGLRRFLDGNDVSEVEFEAALCGFSDLLRGARDLISLRGRVRSTIEESP